MSKMNDIILYPEAGWDPPKILECIENRKTVKEYAMILHDQDVKDDGSPKKPHYHLFLNYGSSNPKYKDVASWFCIPENDVGKVHSNKYRTIRYYLHLDEADKHKYRVEDIIASFDVKSYLESEASKLSKDELIEKCADGTITRNNFSKYIDAKTFVKYQRQIESAWDFRDYRLDIESGGERNIQTIWIYGKTGTGKTTIAILFAKQRDMSYSLSAGGKDVVSHYRNEDVFIIDDPRPDNFKGFNDFLRMIDPHHSSPVDSRYHNKRIYAKYIIITNPYSPDEFFALMSDKAANEDPHQLYRRIYQKWEVTPDKIYIHRYDKEKKNYILEGVRDNPVLNMFDDNNNFMPEDALSILDDICGPESQEVLEGGDADEEIPF